jgi:hypothetical protein
MDQTRKSLIVEGWRFVTHSYAITNHWQLLALLKRGDFSIRVRDMPFLGHKLQDISSVFDPIAVDQLRAIPPASVDDSADVTLRCRWSFSLLHLLT